MKKKKTSTTKTITTASLPTDTPTTPEVTVTETTTVTSPVLDSTSTDTTADSSSETTPVENTAPRSPVITTPEPEVPSIDKDASLKIEETEMLTEELPVQEKKGKLLLILGSIFGVLILGGVITMAVFYYKTPEKEAVTVVESTPTPSVTETPQITLKNEEITFDIQNGSGVAGLAAKYGKQLEDLGYTVESLGNAEGDHTGLAVFLATKLDSQKDILLSDLKKEFPDASYSGVLTDGDTLVRLIIGE